MSLPPGLPFYTVEYVLARLELAGSTLIALPGTGCLPAGMKSNWPDFARQAIEAYGYTEARVRPPVPRARAITEMDEAFAWVGLVDDVRTRRLLLLRALVDPITDRHRWSWRRLDSSFGIHRDTLRLWHGRGIGRIVTRLNDPSWRPPPSEGASLLLRESRGSPSDG